MTLPKILFSILGALLTGAVIFLVLAVTGEDVSTGPQISAGDMSIWILKDDVGDFQNYLTGFKGVFPEYASKNIDVQSFNDLVSYKNALVSSISAGTAPDIFMVPQNEVSIFENQIQAVDPNIVSPNDFRLAFLQNFGEDLIVSDPDDSSIEFLKGIPIGYETLGFLYNRKYFLRPSELTSWSNVNREIKNISDKYSKIIPVALGTSSGISRLREVLGAFFVLEGEAVVGQMQTTIAKQVLSQYKSYGERSGDNAYEVRTNTQTPKTDIEIFTEGDVAAMLGFPRDLLQIDKIGYQKNFLFSAPFPQRSSSSDTSLISIEYNFFALNKDSDNQTMAQDFLAFAATSQGQQSYVDNFPYYLSPSVSVGADMAEKKILPDYNIVYKNFVPEGAQLTAFNYGDIIVFDGEIHSIIETDFRPEEELNRLGSYLTCMTTKHATGLNLSSPCK